MFEKLKFKHYAIIVADFILLWYFPVFLNTAHSFINLLGFILLITLFILTLKIFKK